MNPLDKLISHFEKFPGVGARQAKRFAFHVLTLPEAERPNIAEIMVEKHRNGAVGFAELYFDGQHVRFLNLDTHHAAVPGAGDDF